MKISDAYRLERIVSIGTLLINTLAEDHITEESLKGEYRHQWLVTTPLYNIGEQVYCLSKEFKDAHPEIEWSGVSGLRHRLVHDYQGTNWSIISSIVFSDLPVFLNQIQVILSTEKPD